MSQANLIEPIRSGSLKDKQFSWQMSSSLTTLAPAFNPVSSDGLALLKSKRSFPDGKSNQIPNENVELSPETPETPETPVSPIFTDCMGTVDPKLLNSRTLHYTSGSEYDEDDDASAYSSSDELFNSYRVITNPAVPVVKRDWGMNPEFNLAVATWIKETDEERIRVRAAQLAEEKALAKAQAKRQAEARAAKLAAQQNAYLAERAASQALEVQRQEAAARAQDEAIAAIAKVEIDEAMKFAMENFAQPSINPLISVPRPTQRRKSVSEIPSATNRPRPRSNSLVSKSTLSSPKRARAKLPVPEIYEKPFQCHRCCIRFKRTEHLKRHVRSVHTSVRPFPCLYCEKKFSRSDNLAQHVKIHPEAKAPTGRVRRRKRKT